MNYADFNYYMNTYYGKISADDFKNYIRQASNIIDKNINYELDEKEFENLNQKAQAQLKDTACALVDLIAKREKSEKSTASISIDGVSKTFKIMTEDEFKTKTKECLSFLPDELVRFL